MVFGDRAWIEGYVVDWQNFAPRTRERTGETL